MSNDQQPIIILSGVELRAWLKSRRLQSPGAVVGFVPTMGFLHEGHASLLTAARQSCDIVVLSIFVNPLQFGPNEDFERYPRDEQRDLAIAAEYGADVVFMPQVEEMYPERTRTTVTVSGVTERLCGASRPGHFDGVATVVTKLFNLVQPDRAYFGLKDAQQVAVIEQMVRDLNVPVEIVPCATVREADGLAKSSRNVYLSAEEREQAVILNKALREAEQQLRTQRDAMSSQELAAQVTARIQEAPLARIDYVEALAYPSLEPISSFTEAEQALIAVAVKFGNTRLIDNCLIRFNG
ncbi:pantoate--beta-alanine ligase [Paenibacillus sp. YYML68]|uniref:pantoate--beta-alanine ligase n=1 Tax=Paenibacillus sp. YYML68 TaxID=2909250 RepID=UPI0024923E69|nr:pantoate--beta-alanine ligase [Paenibacillus sp. YYML68]